MRILSFLSRIVAFIVFTIVVFVACRKTDQSPAQQTTVKNSVSNEFFSVSPNTDHIVQVIANNVYNQNERKPLTEALVKRIGYPVWDHSLIAEGPGKTRSAAQKVRLAQKTNQRIIIYIPFAKKEERITKAVLRVIIDGADTAFHMLYPHQYCRYGFEESTTKKWNAQTLFSLFSDFDNALFGTEKYLVKDGRMFGKKKEDLLVVTVSPVIANAGQPGTAGKLILISECKYITACVYASESTGSGGNCTTIAKCSSYWLEDGGAGGGGGGTSAGEDGGGSGGGGGGETGTDENWPEDPCADQPVLVSRGETYGWW